MTRRDVDSNLARVETLATEIETFVPTDNRYVTFRADLAGLLVVAMAASYGTCVKDTVVNYASRHHTRFAFFAQKQLGRLSSRIRVSHLYEYARACDGAVNNKLGLVLKKRKQRIKLRTGKDIAACYDQILNWRNDFAHEGLRNTTVEEALATHTLAKRVLYAFDEAFD